MISPIVGITGADGFLGWHLRCLLRVRGIAAISAGRETFADQQRLEAFVQESDIIVHAAGVNRADTETEVREGNLFPASMLVNAMKGSGRPTPVIYSNSTKSEVGGVYGEAKLAAAETLKNYLADVGEAFVDLVLPHLFGEFGQPFYNSAVTTFAHQLAIGGEVEVFREGQLELLHVQDVAAEIVSLLPSVPSRPVRMRGRLTTVGSVWDLLSAQYRRYVDQNTVPAFNDQYELQVFNTLRSQLDNSGFYPRPIMLHSDPRGTFSELCRADGSGQTSISTTAPGITRGDHFHLNKVERFVVVGGSARIRLRRLLDDTIRVIDVTGSKPVFIDMPPLTTHNITNTGDDVMTTVFWAADHFDPVNPDTHPEVVELEREQQ